MDLGEGEAEVVVGAVSVEDWGLEGEETTFGMY